MRYLIAVCLLMFSASGARADTAATDRQAIQRVIEKQIDAFRRDDAVGAFQHASPKIKLIFRSPQIFMTMVKRGYPQIYRADQVRFLKLEEGEDGHVQRVMIKDRKGNLVVALYRMMRRSDGTWVINGCKLVTNDPV